ncbi:excisionase family DNA-binding protein [Ketogulonicigenium vulgare]|uniref:excisionase family DNA-binding protein n=2 Tax=Ketogulonicigenium vulgare TaxID=92945 RepID=UPI0011D040A8|nr:excisionase family DNA-binding protein [Ketogulonicigenium vulgare]
MIMSAQRAQKPDIKHYTADTLAEHWECSGETVRKMLRDGKLQGFRVGKSWRIPKSIVEEHEQCQNIESDDSVVDTVSPGQIQTEGGADTSSTQQLQRKPKLKLDRSFTKRRLRAL